MAAGHFPLVVGQSSLAHYTVPLKYTQARGLRSIRAATNTYSRHSMYHTCKIFAFPTPRIGLL